MLIIAWLVTICHAQITDREISTEATIFTVIASLMCFTFWCCFIFMCCSKQKCNITSRDSSPSNSYHAESSPSPQTHMNRRHQQIVCSSQSRVLYRQPAVIATYHTSKPDTVVLSQASLQLGDAPPSYEEAVRMTEWLMVCISYCIQLQLYLITTIFVHTVCRSWLFYIVCWLQQNVW